jgi:hypothetical protein
MTESILISNKKLKIELFLETIKNRINDSKDDGYKILLDSHCNTLKDEIDLSKESEICNIESSRIKMLNKVKDFEEILIKNFENIDMEKLEEFVDGKKNDLKQDEDSRTLEEIQKSIYTKIRELEQILFSNQYINYRENICILDSSNIGLLSFEPFFQLSNYNLKNPRIFRFPNPKRKSMKFINIGEINENEFAFCYNYTGNDLNSFNVNLLDVKSRNMQSFHVDWSQNIAITIINNRLIVALKREKTRTYLAYYNKISFEIEHEILVDHTISSLHTHNNKIYATSTMPLIFHVYNDHLQKLCNFGQMSNPSALSFIPVNRYKGLKFSFKENYIFIFDGKTVNIFNEKTLENEKHIIIKNNTENLNYFNAISLNRFIIGDFKKKCIRMYDLNGECIEEFFFLKPNLTSKIYLTKNLTLLIVNPNTMRVYIYSL